MNIVIHVVTTDTEFNPDDFQMMILDGIILFLLLTILLPHNGLLVHSLFLTIFIT